MQTIMVYSEAGGVSKTTTSVSLAMVAAEQGHKVVLIDLDPRATTTKWIGVEPVGKGLHVGAILASEDNTAGYLQELAVPSGWHDNLRVLPSATSVSNREKDVADHAELRLKTSIEGVDADLVIIDCPNRQGGPLTQAALNASDQVIYAARPDTEGLEGFEGAQNTVRKFNQARAAIGAPVTLREAGIVVSGIETIPTRITTATVQDFEATGLLLYPLIPSRVIVKEARRTGEWYGNYDKGAPVVEAYAQLLKKVLA